MDTLVHPIFCRNPYVIINPQAVAIAPYCVEWSFPNGQIKPRTWTDNDNIPWKMLNRVRYILRDKLIASSLDYRVFDNYYIVNGYKDKIPIFIAVPCTHCDCCQHTKSTNLMQQVNFEMQLHDVKPLWITLTYNNSHLPEDKMLHYSHFQSFMKRLRINLARNFQYHFPLKYVVVGEYGPINGRPHFHLMLFGLDYIHFAENEVSAFKLVQRLIAFSWLNTSDKDQYTFSQYNTECDENNITPDNDYNRHPSSRGHVDVQLLRDGYASYYLSKYVAKQGLRIHKSINLGYDFAKQFKESIANGDTTITYFDHLNGVQHDDEILVSYFFNKLFPRPSSFIEPQLKRYALSLLGVLNNIENYFASIDVESNIDSDGIIQQVLNEFPFLSYVRFPQSVDPLNYDLEANFNLLSKLIIELNECYEQNRFDWDEIQKIIQTRETYYDRIQQKFNHITILDRIKKLENKVIKPSFHPDNQ